MLFPNTHLQAVQINISHYKHDDMFVIRSPYQKYNQFTLSVLRGLLFAGCPILHFFVQCNFNFMVLRIWTISKLLIVYVIPFNPWCKGYGILMVFSPLTLVYCHIIFNLFGKWVTFVYQKLQSTSLLKDCCKQNN